jgi:hypothetical protein
LVFAVNPDGHANTTHSINENVPEVLTTSATQNACGLSSDFLFSLVPARMAHGHHFQPIHRETNGSEWRQACFLSVASLSTAHSGNVKPFPEQDVQSRHVCMRRGAFPALYAGNRPFRGPLHEHKRRHPPSRRRVLVFVRIPNPKAGIETFDQWIRIYLTNRRALSPARSIRTGGDMLLRFLPLQRSRSGGATCPGFASPSTLRPQVFSTSRRFAPPHSRSSLFHLE